ncbi:MAG: DUF4298 domain-containing protein [Lachnospiraceae bacterium]|nr:DUF4298 domain-containing protein [Lachnospiraceae bacterium]
MEKKNYTIGEFGRISGVSAKTIRFYDEKGLLKPVGYSEAGYRYYDESSFVTLQRILLLRYLGMSLEQIKEIVRDSTLSLEDSLQEQKKLLYEKKRHLDRVIDAVDKVQNAAEGQTWENLVEAIRILEVSDMVIKQYKSDDNLNRRINIHNYSTGAIPWADWVLEQLELSEGMDILCLGCGNAANLAAMADHLPGNLTFLLTDYSEGMLEKAKVNLATKKAVFKEKNIAISYQVADANCLSLTGAYDRITANHMLYHVEKRQELFEKVKLLLKPEGMFCATTIGETHMQELHDYVKSFDARIEQPFEYLTCSFQLENGREQLQTVFPDIECVICDSDLLVDRAEPLYEYVYSFPGNAAEMLRGRKKEFLRNAEEIIEKEGAFYIHKSTGMFRCRVSEKEKQLEVLQSSDEELQRTIARIEQMERYFDEIQRAVEKDAGRVFEDESLQEKWKNLLEYYEGGQWLKDYECDERGELPKGLKRGVLSEDGVYNLLSEIEA